MRILLAEDERSLSRAILKILEKNNYSADAAYDGEQALSCLLSGRYDGAILDIMMPKMDGITVLKNPERQHTDPRRPQRRILSGGNLMIKKLRRKLIAVSMLSLFLVLFVILGAVNILNYREIVENADRTLSMLQAGQGTFPDPGDNPPPGEGRPRMSPELPYESRYFSVLLSGSGRIISVDTGRISAVNTSEAMEYASRVWENGSERGFVTNYRYVRSEENAGTRIIFLDCAGDLATCRSFLFSSCAISALGLLAAWLLILLFSRRIVRPITESYEKQKQFVSNAGHEIKTPITIIDADTEGSQTKRLASLTSDLISLSRLEEAGSRLPRIDFPFSDRTAETAQSFQTLARTMGKTLDLSIEPMLSLCGDEKALTQLVSILLDNALKYSPEGSRISLSLKRQGKQVRLTAANPAKLLTGEDLKHMFDRFYRGDKSRSETPGYGIGLAMARAIADAHKGRLTARLEEPELLVIEAVFEPARLARKS